MSFSKSLHILAFNIPYPADYGGVIDVFYKIVALKNIGVDIHLHCFEYGRKHAEILQKHCKIVHYYQRKQGIKHLFSPTPYFVETRYNKTLMHRLIESPFPIISEGIHCSKTLLNPLLKNQRKYLRAHNVETEYYKELYRNNSNIWNKIYFYSEFLKLKQYEKNTALFNGVFSISKNDHEYFKTISNSHYIRAFHSNLSLEVKQGSGKYALYHGNLSIYENINAVLFLIKNVFTLTNYPFIIAGKNPNQKIIDAIKSHPHISIVANPANNKMNELIMEAQMILLPTNQCTGIKLKLIESLYKGRFCVVNQKMIANTELAPFCHLANSPQEWLDAINSLKELEFNVNEVQKRRKIKAIFNNKYEAQKIVDIIFEEK